jgi:hypothetical protein
MKKLGMFAAGVVTILAMTVPVTSAQAADGANSTARVSAAAAEDGKLHAWEHAYGGGDHCSWTGSSRHWDGNNEAAQPGCGGMRNRATSLRNSAYAGWDAVNLYWDTDQDGAWACLGKGDEWMDLALGWETFSHRSWPFNHGGYGESLHDNISSHQWVESC